MAGGVVSTKERGWTQVARLPQASVAFQVRSIPGTPAQAAAVIASVKVIVTGPPQLSVAVAEPVCAGSVGSPQLSCWSAGQVMAGGVVSTKERCWTQVARLPQASVAFHVRSIPGTPAQAIAVIASVKVIVTGPPQLSVAVAEPVCAGSVGSPQLSCWSAGQVMAGGVVSTKERCWTQVARLPQASVAFQVRSMPARPAQSAGVAASMKLIVTIPAQLSVAVAEPVWAGSIRSPQLSCRLAGQEMAGGVVSMKVRCWTQVARLPQASVAFQVRSMPARPAQPATGGASVKVIVTIPAQLSVAVAEAVWAVSMGSPELSC